MNKVYCFLLCLFSSWAMVCMAQSSGSTLTKAKKKGNSIIVTAEGIGTSADDALSNAFKEAVYQAVGVYMVSATKLNDDDIDDKVYLNADAIVHKHKVLEQKREDDGSYYVKIKAYVIRNELADRIQKYVTTKVSQTGVISTANKHEAIDTARKSVELLCKGFPDKIVTAEAIGEPEIDNEADFNNDVIFLKQQIQIRINEREYRRFTEQIDKILSSIAVKKQRLIYTKRTQHEDEERDLRRFTEFTDQNKNTVIVFNNKDYTGSRERLSDLSCKMYVVPKPVYDAIPWAPTGYIPWDSRESFALSAILDCVDETGQSLHRERFNLQDHYMLCGFSQAIPKLLHERFSPAVGPLQAKILLPVIWMTHSHADCTSSYSITKSIICKFSMPKDSFKKMRQVIVSVKSGPEALFVEADLKLKRGDYRPMLDLARETGYMPALEKVMGQEWATIYCGIDWRDMAAWGGSRQAMKLLNWTNGGFGCRIGRLEYRYSFTKIWVPVIAESNIKELPVGKEIKTINGAEYKLDTLQGSKALSQIGLMPIGTPVTLEFTDGTKTTVKTISFEELKF